jgi:Spy/CpxP family protein refolding chaperone
MKSSMKSVVNQISLRWVLLIVLFVNAGSLLAQRNDSTRNHFRHARLTRDHGILGLTKDQRDKMDALQTPLSKEMLPLMNQLGEKRAHLRTLQTADKADLTAINATIDEIGQLQSQMMKKRAANTQAIRKLLTDDQRIAFDMKSGRGWDHHRTNAKHRD